jgi:two-component system chemotaxis sensor kinase CheA
MPVVTRASLLGHPEIFRTAATRSSAQAAGCSVYALAFDGVHDHEELVVKPAAPRRRWRSGSTRHHAADDGRPCCCSTRPAWRAAQVLVRRRSRAARAEPPQAAWDRAALLLFRALSGASARVRWPW